MIKHGSPYKELCGICPPCCMQNAYIYLFNQYINKVDKYVSLVRIHLYDIFQFIFSNHQWHKGIHNVYALMPLMIGENKLKYIAQMYMPLCH